MNTKLYKVEMLNGNHNLVKVIGHVNAESKADAEKKAEPIIDAACRRLGTEWLASHGFTFEVKEG